MSAHTPGQWEDKIYGGWDAPRIWSASGSIAILQHHERSPDEAEANARLIAAAPELLEALKRLLSESKEPTQKINVIGAQMQAEDAIAKATGGMV